VVHGFLCFLSELRAQPFDFRDGVVDESTIGAACEWLGVVKPLEYVGAVGVECCGEGVKNFSH
jgi:hypothetical protein